MMATTTLEARGLTVQYPGAAAPVLRGLDLSVRRGEIVAVLGPSGVGKSSLLRILGGLQKPSRGRVEYNGAELEAPHPRVAVAFQDPSLLPWLTLENNVAFGLDFKRQPERSKTERSALIAEAIEEVGLSQFRSLYPAQLSGGMAQRTAIARCLARRPDVLLLDEPFGALDEVTRHDMQQLLLKVVADYQTGALLITHDIDEALNVADRVILLGGAPAHVIGDWRVDIDHPREEAIEQIGELRIEILQTLREAIRPQAKDRKPCAMNASLVAAC